MASEHMIGLAVQRDTQASDIWHVAAMHPDTDFTNSMNKIACNQESPVTKKKGA